LWRIASARACVLDALGFCQACARADGTDAAASVTKPKPATVQPSNFEAERLPYADD
jgi:hypothetical protein